jgi:hypothetical protein
MVRRKGTKDLTSGMGNKAGRTRLPLRGCLLGEVKRQGDKTGKRLSENKEAGLGGRYNKIWKRG